MEVDVCFTSSGLKGTIVSFCQYHGSGRLKLQTDAEIVRVSGSDAADYGASCHEEVRIQEAEWLMVGRV